MENFTILKSIVPDAEFPKPVHIALHLQLTDFLYSETPTFKINLRMLVIYARVLNH